MNDVISELRAAFDELAERAPVDVADRLRTDRHRKPYALALLAAAAVVAIAVGTVAVAAHHTGHGKVMPAANTPTSTGTVPPTPQTVAANFIGLLGTQGKVSELAGEGYGNFVHARMKYDGGHGQAGIEVDLFWPQTPTTVGKISPPQSCTAINATTAANPGGSTTIDGKLVTNPLLDCATLPDGTQLGATPKDWIASAPTDGQRPNELTALRPDGIEIDIYQGPDGTGQPPYTKDQLIAFATDPSWTASVPAASAQAAEKLFVPQFTATSPVLVPSPTATGTK